MAADEDYTTKGGAKIPPLQMTPAMFVDRSLVVYGPSKTGKTKITKCIMKAVSSRIEQILIVSPTEPTNRAYSGFVDRPFIHYRLYLPPEPGSKASARANDSTLGALRFLEAVWKRQEMMAAIYTRANNPDILANLFGRIPGKTRAEGVRHIKTMNERRKDVLERVAKKFAGDPGRVSEKQKEVNDKFKQLLILLYKKYITGHYDGLWDADLSEDERCSLVYLSFNPRLLIVFDDCAADLKAILNRDIFRRFFYQNRHSFITIIVTAQDDTDVAANLRKNAYISFFTEPVVCSSNFERPTNKFPKPTRDLVTDILAGQDFFTENRKLAYIREDDRRQHFYYVQAPLLPPFRFGSKALHELSDAVQNDGVAMDKDNPYFDYFNQ